jgi:hypothetical protein
MGRSERILSSLAREWLRITNGLLIVGDSEPAPRNPNKLMRVNGAERRRKGKATRRRTCEMKVESDVLIYFNYEDTKRNFSDPAR